MKNKKLEFKKETVSVLSKDEMNDVHGGDAITPAITTSSVGCIIGLVGVGVGIVTLFRGNRNDGPNSAELNDFADLGSVEVYEGACILGDVYVCG